jgi:hypothetical protein
MTDPDPSCDEGKDACNVHSAEPLVPVAKTRMHATHGLPGLRCMRCLQRRQGCMQPMFCWARGACGEDTDACNRRSAVPA